MISISDAELHIPFSKSAISNMTTPIPQPPGLPLVGNVLDVDPSSPLLGIKRLNQKYGEIFKLSILGNDRYFLCSERLVREACDESRFVKSIGGALEQVRNGVGGGLFTAYHGEHSWEVAHRTLVPAFGPLPIKDMFDEMYDIASQLVGKWARQDAETRILVTDEFTRLTLDSIALCAMDTRFNSFYHKDMHPFVHAMTDFLIESGARVRRTRLEALLNPQFERKYNENIALMKSVAQEMINKRRKTPSDKKDLLNALLFGKDPKTGEQLDDDNIMNNMITFAIAGHETTSGLLSFTLFHLLKNPEAMQKLTEEVDTVVGKGRVKYEHLSKLNYMEACLRESLRISPTAPAFTIQSKPGTTEPFILAGEYTLPADATMICWITRSQVDPVVYGEDAEEFKPERMLTENFQKLPSAAWKPFGNGVRGCIGRPFAWQEALLALAMVIQNFNIRLADPSYELNVKSTLTVKPDGFYVKASLRPGIDPIAIEKRMFGDVEAADKDRAKAVAINVDNKDLKPMTILFGSNSGTCDGLAQSLASEAASNGFKATVKPLDAAVEKFPASIPVIIISASYEGLPPDNAAQFVQWMKTADPSNFKGSQIAVFSCGHKDWVSTYHKIPRLIDDTLTEKGCSRIIPRGGTNVAEGKIFDDFDAWGDQLWSALGSSNTTITEGLDLQLSTSTRSKNLRHAVQDALVLKNDLLTGEGAPGEKRFIEFQLPSTASYETGDYLAILPLNSLPVVGRILRRFRLPWDATMKLKKGSHSSMPTEVELSVSVVLASYVELNAAATKKNLQTLANYQEESVIDPNTPTQQSVLDLLEKYADLEVPFGVYLSMLPPMRIRQYSISSSPLARPGVASISFSVAADKDPDVELHPGVATHYLKSLKVGSTAQLAVRKSPAGFHPPTDLSTPMIMACAGTGLAPFRGFIQDRAAKIAAAPKSEIAPALLFIGCRDPKFDKIHAEELEQWQSEGAVKVYYAFSRAAEQSEGCKYVQDRVWNERKEVGELFEKGAKTYICGSAAVGKGLGDVAARIRVADAERKGEAMTQEDALKWWQGLRGERYAVDVFD